MSINPKFDQKSSSEPKFPLGPLRIEKQGFISERTTYLSKLKEASNNGPWPEELKRHSVPWPVDMQNQEIHFSCFYGDKNYAQPSFPLLHEGLDIQAKVGTIVTAPERSRIIFVDQKDSLRGLADVYLYSEESGILYVMAHLNINDVSRKLLNCTTWNPESSLYLSASTKVGTVAAFGTQESQLSPETNIPIDIEQVYGRRYDHLHIQTHYYPTVQQLMQAKPDTLKQNINPILLFKELYKLKA